MIDYFIHQAFEPKELTFAIFIVAELIAIIGCILAFFLPNIYQNISKLEEQCRFYQSQIEYLHKTIYRQQKQISDYKEQFEELSRKISSGEINNK